MDRGLLLFPPRHPAKPLFLPLSATCRCTLRHRAWAFGPDARATSDFPGHPLLPPHPRVFFLVLLALHDSIARWPPQESLSVDPPVRPCRVIVPRGRLTSIRTAVLSPLPCFLSSPLGPHSPTFRRACQSAGTAPVPRNAHAFPDASIQPEESRTERGLWHGGISIPRHWPQVPFFKGHRPAPEIACSARSLRTCASARRGAPADGGPRAWHRHKRVPSRGAWQC